MACIDDVSKRLKLDTDGMYWATALCASNVDQTSIVDYITKFNEWRSLLAEAKKLCLVLTETDIQELLEAFQSGKKTKVKAILQKLQLKALAILAKSNAPKNN